MQREEDQAVTSTAAHHTGERCYRNLCSCIHRNVVVAQLGHIGRAVYLRELCVESKQLKQPQFKGTNLREVGTRQWVWMGLLMTNFSELK